MTKLVPAAILAAVLAVSGCQMTDTERTIVGGAAGAGAGLAVSNLLGANTNWTIIGTVAGATAGSLLARNTQTGQCAYARGDGTYYEAPCR
ncbi:MAG: glycine zipper 2TM domain-containing protein [Rhodobacteraceae bacterium]|nr:glycine zipper 2TM domain-containing protein [Paracoccaceae bacterium]TVR48588.1 MAG: glycine zipper 2TM domain-containing protein [Paracoccaceae bacterium]